MSQLGRPPTDLASRLEYYTANPPKTIDGRIEEEEDDRGDKTKDDEKGDKVELSNFASEAIEEAVGNALHSMVNGATQQVFVSEDGRYQATIDLQVNRDGSFNLDISVGMAASRTAGAQLLQGEPINHGLELRAYPGNTSFVSARVLQETTLEYERQIATRDWEAQIFYSSTERVAAGVSRVHGPDVGGKVLSVGSELSREFQMNISISGENLDSFLAQIDELSASEEASELTGFLDAVGNVLRAAPDDLGDLLNATEALIARVGEQVAEAVNHFFTGIWDTFGSELQDFGFGSDFIEEMNENAQQGLKDFLGVTNHFFENILGLPENQTLEDPRADSNARLLKESLELQKEALQERLEEVKENRSAKTPTLRLLA